MYLSRLLERSGFKKALVKFEEVMARHYSINESQMREMDLTHLL